MIIYSMHDIITFISPHILLVDTGRHSRGLGRVEQLRSLTPDLDKNSSFCYPFKERTIFYDPDIFCFANKIL